MGYRTIGARIAAPQGYNEPVKKEERTSKTDVATMGLGIGQKAYKFREGVIARKLANSGLTTDTNLTYKVGDKDLRMFKPKSGINLGRYSKRYEVDPGYYDEMKINHPDLSAKQIDESVIDKLQNTGNFNEKEIADLMGVNNRDYNAWKASRGGEGSVADYLDIVQRGTIDTDAISLEGTAYKDAFDTANQATFDSLGLPGSSEPFSIPQSSSLWSSSPNEFGRIKAQYHTGLDTVDWSGRIKRPQTSYDSAFGLEPPTGGLPKNKIRYDKDFLDNFSNRKQKIMDPKAHTPWGEGKIGDKTGAGFFKRIGTDEGFFKRLGRGEGPVGQKLGNLSKIGQGGIKNLWQSSTPGKVTKAVMNIGKGGLKGLFGGAGATTAATTATTAATTAATGASTGLFAAMGPVGWTMMAASLLSNKKLLHNLGKIFSDTRLKENIEKVGLSPSGINIYEFNYKGGKGKYRGVLADEVPWAASKDKDGFKMVDYSQVDVPFEKVN